MADGTINLDGRKVPFHKGDTIISAARKAGIDIPHYCWHPGLSAPANCRMCLVEVGPPPGRPPMMLDVLQWDAKLGEYTADKKPKLFPACQMACNDGMEVKSDTSEHVSDARAAVQEFLLLNHPVDCPICDQAGECDLQDYWLEHMRSKKRMHQEPVHKPKGVVFGDTIVYDAERCIMCTRCVRVCDEVAGDPVLDMRERGNRNEIVVAPGRKLDNNYSLMTEHVCPVGALTSSHFRFKARVWFLRSGRTVCQGCSTGCNAYLDYDPRDNKPYRYRPRDNDQVNKYWMCDEGMLSYPQAYEGRVLSALVGGEDATVQQGLAAAAKQLESHGEDPSQVAVVVSSECSTEDNFALLTLAKQFIGTDQVFLARRPDGDGDDVLMDCDKNPNSEGVRRLCKRLGLGPAKPFSALLAAIDDGTIRYAISIGTQLDCDANEAKRSLSVLKGYVAICSHEGPLSKTAHITLPACSWAEVEGTYVNRTGIPQRADAVLEPMGDAYPAWELIVTLGAALGYDLEWRSRRDLMRAMRRAKKDSRPPPPINDTSGGAAVEGGP